MKENTKNQLLIAFVCVIIGIFLTVQFKAVQSNFLAGLIPSKRLNQLMVEYDKLKSEKANKTAELDDLQSRLDEITKSSASNNALIGDLQNQLEKYKAIAGFTDVHGDGIVVEIDNDHIGSSAAKIEDEFQYLLLVINELNASGAEAISINNQRFIASTEIRSTNNKIMINSNQQEAPFIIKAIGNTEVLEAAMMQRFGVVKILRDRGFNVNVSVNTNLTIAKYTDAINWKYAKVLKK